MRLSRSVVIAIKRIYEPPLKSDGYRILVDRLWPRGIKKDSGAIDKWLKEVAPSTELRKWVHSDPGKWNEFRQHYLQELKENEAIVNLLELIHSHSKVTLLYAAKDEQQNHALILQKFLNSEGNSMPGE